MKTDKTGAIRGEEMREVPRREEMRGIPRREEMRGIPRGGVMRGVPRRYVCLALGSLFLTFIGWRFNVAAASWLAPVFLIRFFRDEKRWAVALLAIPLLAVASFVQLDGGWDLEPWMAYLFSVLRPAAFIAGLYADRYLNKRLPAFASTLVFPSVYLAVDYAIAFTPLGSGMSMSATQFGFPAVLQLASITGIWGIGFLMGWIAACLNTL